MAQKTLVLLIAATALAGFGGLARSEPTAHQSAVPKSCPGAGPKEPLLEVVNVPADTGDDLVPVGTPLKPGTRYTVVVCGTILRKHPYPEGRRSTADAFYRVSCTEKDGSACDETLPIASAHLNATDRRDKTPFARGALQWFGRGAGNPDYRSNHTYTLSLDDLGPGLELKHGVCCPGEAKGGGFRVEIYGPPPKTYALTFSVRQRGEPVPPTRDDLAGTETTGGGKVFFSAVPRSGAKTKGTPAGVVTHGDDLVLPDLSTTEREIEVRITRATYKKTAKGRSLSLAATPVSASGEARIHLIGEASLVRIVINDAVDDEDDSFAWSCVCFGDEGPEAHVYAAGPKNRLAVRIGPVSRVDD